MSTRYGEWEGKAVPRLTPPLLWVSIVALGVMSLTQAALGLAKGSGQLLFCAVANVVLMWGLARGHRWAYVLVLVFGLLGIAVAAGQSATLGVGVSIGNGLVLVPMVISTRFFFPAPPSD